MGIFYKPKKVGLVLSILTLGIALTFAQPASAARYTDGLSWSNCSGRTTLHYKTFGSAKMWVYACSNGYVFTHVNGSKKGPAKSALIIRYNSKAGPYAQEVRGSNGYTATSDMVAHLKGSCFKARGYMDGSGAREFSFCR